MNDSATIRATAFWPWPGLIVLALAVVRTVTHLSDIDLKIAGYDVSSPLGYIWLHLNPALAAIDWPAGSADFRFSLPMRALLWLVQATGIAPESTIWPFGFAQMVLMLVAFGYLAHVLFRHAPTTIALTVVASLAPVAGVNLGNFGGGLGNGSAVLFYMWAHGFGFLALAFALRERYAVAALMAAAATWSHLTLGLFMTAFIGVAMLAAPRRLLTWRAAGAVALYAVLIVPLAALVFEGAHVATGEISRADWVLMSRLFNWHWHPIELGLFGPFATIGIYPILVLVLGYALARRHVSAGTETDRMLLAGMILTAILTVIGILLSEVWPIPVVMKLALQRSSEIASLVMLAYIVRDLVRRIEADAVLLAIIAALMLCALVLVHTGIALLPLLIFAAADAWRAKTWRTAAIWGILAASVAALGLAETLGIGVGLTARLWTPFARPEHALIGGVLLRPWFGWLALALAAGFLVLARAPRRWWQAAGATALAIAVLIVVQQVRWSDWAAANRARLVAYKDAQLWAASHTPPDAVFLTNPAVSDGWREYSRRAEFGTLSELAHYATLYDSAPGLFAKGLDRVRAFGVDPLAVDRNALVLPGGGKYGISVLAPKVGAAFNAMGAEALKALARRYGVRYVVVLRAARTAPLAFTPVYSNAAYDIYDLAPPS